MVFLKAAILEREGKKIIKKLKKNMSLRSFVHVSYCYVAAYAFVKQA